MARLESLKPISPLPYEKEEKESLIMIEALIKENRSYGNKLGLITDKYTNNFFIQLLSEISPYNEEILIFLKEKELQKVIEATLKDYQLIAELRQAGAGNLLINLIYDQTINIRNESFWENFDSIIEYGKMYKELAIEEANIVDAGTIREELHHFSQIMSIDLLQEEEKKTYNSVDDGLERMVNGLQAVIEERVGENLFLPPPNLETIKGRIVCSTTKQSIFYAENPSLNYSLQLISEHYSKEIDIKDIQKINEYLGIDKNNQNTEFILKKLQYIFQKLINKYPAEKALIFLDKYISKSKELTNLKLSAIFCQVYKKEDQLMSKQLMIGNGNIFVINPNTTIPEERASNTLLSNNATKQLGSLYQATLQRVDWPIKKGDIILSLPQGYSDAQTKDQTSLMNLLRKIKSHKFPYIRSIIMKNIKIPPFFKERKMVHIIKIANLKTRDLEYFDWNPSAIQEKGQPLLNYLSSIIKLFEKTTINLQVAHIHSNRIATIQPDGKISSFGNDQKISVALANQLCKSLRERFGDKIENKIMPLIDNFHLKDLINYQNYEKSITEQGSEKIEELLLEDSLPLNIIAIEAYKRLKQLHPNKIFQKGNGIFLKIENNRLIQLFDSVNKKNYPVTGCVLFEAGLEIYRLNPPLANQLFFEWLENKHPQSKLLMWHKSEPNLSYHQLVIKYLYNIYTDPRIREYKKRELLYSLLPNIEDITKETPFISNILMNFKHEVASGYMTIPLHILEGLYSTQGEKFESLWNFLGLSNIAIPRLNFNSDSGLTSLHIIGDHTSSLNSKEHQTLN